MSSSLPLQLPKRLRSLQPGLRWALPRVGFLLFRTCVLVFLGVGISTSTPLVVYYSAAEPDIGWGVEIWLRKGATL